MLDDPHRSVVFRLVREIPDDVTWALTGSANLAVRGHHVDPSDIEVQTDDGGIAAIERAFDDCVETPDRVVESGDVTSSLGELSVESVVVELMGDLQFRSPDGTWEHPVDLNGHVEREAIDGTAVPVLSLDSLARTYRQLGRDDRAAQVDRLRE